MTEEYLVLDSIRHATMSLGQLPFQHLVVVAGFFLGVELVIIYSYTTEGSYYLRIVYLEKLGKTEGW